MSATKILGSLMEAEAVEAVKACMRSVCASEIQLLAIVAGGEYHWMKNAGKAFAGMAVPDQVLHDMFRYFKARAGEQPSKQLDAILKAKATADQDSHGLDDIVES